MQLLDRAFADVRVYCEEKGDRKDYAQRLDNEHGKEVRESRRGDWAVVMGLIKSDEVIIVLEEINYADETKGESGI